MQSGRHRLTHHKPKKLIAPYGGELIDLLAPAEDIDALREQARDLPSVQLSERSVCDLELLATGAFSPLDRFMGKDDFERVLDDMRLTTGHIFPVPVTLPVSVDTPLEIRKARDTKGLYAKARQGEIVGFTGIDDPYEIPKHPEFKLDTVDHTSEQNARAILDYLMQQGLIKHEEWEEVGSALPAPAADSPDVRQEHGGVA